MNNCAFVFPGQGSQTVGMLADLAYKNKIILETFNEANSVLNYSLWDIVQLGPSEKLNETIYTQVAMLVADVALFRLINNLTRVEISLMAGHSLGEYAALVCAGALSLPDATSLIQKPSKLMQQHVPLGLGAMAAIVGLEDESVKQLCQEVSDANYKVMPANYNAIGQVVVAGHTEAVYKLIKAAETKNARLAKLIPVSVPCHCELLEKAATEFNTVLHATQFKEPSFAILSTVDALAYISPSDIRTRLTQQLYSPVQWVAIIQAMADKGITKIVECGPGQVLSGLIKRIDRSITTYNTNSEDALTRIKRDGE